MPTLPPELKTRLDYLIDKIIIEEATIPEKIEAVEISKNYVRNL